MASRITAAAGGGYAVAALFTATLALLLPRVSQASRAEALLAATLWSFAVYALAIMGVFAARSATRAWLGLGLSALALAGAWLGLKVWP